jgi:chloramphenicol 3-O phosphotransferase
LDIIIDEAFIEESILFHYVKELHNYKVYFIGVMCDLSELERREKSRGDREIGLARGQVDVVHKHHSYYDFTVDTTHISTDKCVQEIVSYINNNPMPTGFKRLYNAYHNS